MAFFDWDPSFSVHIEQFDNHHKALIGMLNEAHENLMTKASQEATRVVIDRLVDYAQEHFSVEEEWMKAHNFEGLSNHVAEHDMFWRKLLDFQTDFHRGNKRLSTEVLNFLKDWLQEHVLLTDAGYGAFAAKLGLAGVEAP
jgi:hemerythrin